MVRVQEEVFDFAKEYAQLANSSKDIGAVVCFSGLVRDFNQSKNISKLSIEHYPGMTERVLENISDQAKKRWPISQICIIHRVGKLLPGDQIVFVGVSSAHREAAFNACQFIMDFLKTQAPFWKKEFTDTSEYWLDAQEKDQVAAERWYNN